MDEEMFKNHIDFIEPNMPGLWSEKIIVITEDYEIKGYVFMPKTGKRNRILSDILNSNKRFVAVKDVEISYRKFPEKKAEKQDFIQINLNSIVLLRPISE